MDDPPELPETDINEPTPDEVLTIVAGPDEIDGFAEQIQGGELDGYSMFCLHAEDADSPPVHIMFSRHAVGKLIMMATQFLVEQAYVGDENLPDDEDGDIEAADKDYTEDSPTPE